MAYGEEFYINYEECKFKDIWSRQWNGWRFYINYEECKSFIVLSNFMHIILFYINYEECKCNKNFLIFKIHEKLYINYEECKLLIKVSHYSYLIWFYINYEKCKCRSTKFNKYRNICFILTIRNVNIFCSYPCLPIWAILS